MKNDRLRRLSFTREAAAVAIAVMVTVGVSILNAQEAALQFEVAC